MSQLESLARFLCVKAGGDPDGTYRATIISGDPLAEGVARRDLTEDRPNWRKYEGRARDLLAFREWESR